MQSGRRDVDNVIRRFRSLSGGEIIRLGRLFDQAALEYQSSGVSLPGLFLAVRQTIREWPLVDRDIRAAHAEVEAELQKVDASDRVLAEPDALQAVNYAAAAVVATGLDLQSRGMLAEPWNRLMAELGAPDDAVVLG